MRVVKIQLRKYLFSSLVLLVFSALITFLVLLNSQTILAADLIFADVALDHPAYSLLENLLRIGAIKPRNGKNLEPFAKISAGEWNYALARAGNALARSIPRSVLFSSNREVTAPAILLRLEQLSDFSENDLSQQHLDVSRLSAYYFLESRLFNNYRD